MGVASATAADQLAFPGASGWGRFAKGARASSAPTVYHVTNLNDSGAGSLRDAVSQPNRVVVFDVSGVIKINSRIVFSSNLYVAGQTAPGEGVTVYGNGVSFSGANNIICRYLRVRMGKGGDSGKDCAGISNGTNMIFDHCSFSWGLDETFSINSDGKGSLGNITLQNCIFSQGLLTHSAGGLMQADYITLYRNFYCDNSTRNNKIKGINQYANNIVYNWQNGCYIMGGDSEGSSYVNIESNLFINGPAKGGNCFGGANADFHCYGDDNWQDSNIDGKFDPQLVTNYSAATRVDKPYDYPALELYNGNELLEKNLPTVGASLPYRDQADYYVVDEVMSYGKQGKIITYETSLPIGAPDTWTWWKGSKAVDSDNDGMPDAWETANGTDPNKADATVVAANGYLNIENYINSIGEEDRQFFLRTPILPVLSVSTTSTLTVAWRDYTYGEDGFIVEIKQADGTWKEVGRTTANAESLKIENLEQGISYDIRIAAFAQKDGAEQRSEYAAATFVTRQVEVGVLDIDTFTPDITLGDAQTVWDKTTTDWKEGKAYADGSKVLLNTDGDKALTISEPVAPEAVVVNGTGSLTLDGVIGGDATTVNKGNSGTLVLNGKNTYTGATVMHGGVVEFSSIANGGQPSAIGASQMFPANWIMDGGTYRYTGASAATDRGAKITAPSTLEIANSGATITASGSFEGTSDFTLDGKGTLAVANAANFFKYSGKTILSGGTLNLTDVENASKAFAGMGKTVVFDGGTINFAYKNEDSQTLAFPIEVNEGTTSTLNAPSHGSLTSTITGGGDLVVKLPWLRFQFSNNMSGFTGKIIANGVPRSKDQTLLYHSSQWNAPTVRFELKGKVYMSAWKTNATNIIGGLSGDAGTYLVGSGKQTAGFACSWTVGAANSDEEFKGVINDLPAGLNSAYNGKVSITKTGTGIWRLSGNNTYSGTTAVTGGTLTINGTKSGTGTVTVGKDAKLNGKGTVTGVVTAYNGAVIEAGDTALYGTSLKFKNTLKLQKGSTLRIPLYRKSAMYRQNNIMFMSTSLNIAEGVTLELDMVNVDEVEDGGYFTIFGTKPTSVTGTFTTIVPEKPAEGFVWDTTDLYTTGKLYIKAEGGSSENPGETPDQPSIPTVMGRTTVYSWESPAGIEKEVGGNATMMNAPADAPDRVNYANGDYFTITLNGKYGNMNDATASAASTYIQIDLDQELAAGDSVFVTAYRNKGTGAEASIYFDYGSAKVADTNAYGDILSGEEPTTHGYCIPEGAAGSSTIKLSRNSASTNLFITKFLVSRWGEVTGVSEVRADGDAADGDAYSLSGQKVGDSYRGIVVSNRQKYLKK